MLCRVFLGSALGRLIAGPIAGEFGSDHTAAFPDQFMQSVLISGGAGLVMLLFSKPIKKLMRGVD